MRRPNNDGVFLFLIILALAIWLLIAVTLRAEPLRAQDAFAFAVAARCKGEAPWAVAPCACTVYNRLTSGGFTEENVLMAYYAANAMPDALDLKATEEVLTNGCRPDLYFMFSPHDVAVVGLDYVFPSLIVREKGGHRSVRFYPQDVFERTDP